MSFYELLRSHGIREDIARAFDEFDRRIFVHESEPNHRVYSDLAVLSFRGKRGYSTSSQPSLMAQFMEWVGLERRMRVLEIGGGTGYNAAVMSRIVGDDGLVVSVEYDEEVYQKALEIRDKLGLENVVFVRGDGYFGYREMAPYDAIVCTVGVDEIPKSWMVQLRDGGRMIVPLNVKSRLFQPAILYRRNGMWMELEYKTATSFIKAGGMLGNLNERNLEKLERVKDAPVVEVISVPRDSMGVLEILTASVARKGVNFYFVEEDGYAIWKRYGWEVHGKTPKLYRVLEFLKSVGFPDIESSAFAHTFDRDDFKEIPWF